MKNQYKDLIEQTFDFPQEEFSLKENQLEFRGIDLMSMIKTYGTPLRFSYLPVIGEQIEKCRNWFAQAFKELSYNGKYSYCYCTKSSHFRFVLEECVKHNTNIETSSAFDIDIIIALFKKGLLSDDTYIICNGYKTETYIQNIAKLIDLGFRRVIPIIDSFDEFDLLDAIIHLSFRYRLSRCSSILSF
jgi:arginine decarboxylase